MCEWDEWEIMVRNKSKVNKTEYKAREKWLQCFHTQQTRVLYLFLIVRQVVQQLTSLVGVQ
jgi:hypothetical protein